MPFDGASKLLDDPVIGRLTVARQKIADGWCQHRGIRRNRLTGRVRHCLAAALDWREELFIMNIIVDDTSNRWRSVVHWNDDPGRTKADVLRLIDCAIGRRRRELLN